jgi:peptidoglycan glycosyltransferase
MFPLSGTIGIFKKIRHFRKGKDILRSAIQSSVPKSILIFSPPILILFFSLVLARDGSSSFGHFSGSHALPPGFPVRDIYGTFPTFDKIIDGKYTTSQKSFQIFYTMDPILQSRVEEIFRKRRPPFGVFIAVEPKSGKLLALADFRQEVSGDKPIWHAGTYPAASIFKLVTAAGALEKGLLSSQSLVSFKGNQYRLGPHKLQESKNRDQRTQFDEALGKSNNVVFGRVASNLLGSQILRHYAEAFAFNRTIPFDYPLEMSKATIPDEPYELARCGAGFGAVTLNPVHAALIAACIANQGLMMKPYLVERIHHPHGRLYYQARPEILARPIREKTAKDLGGMMLRTVEDGTAAQIFHRQGRLLLQKISVSGKTGSLRGEHPPGMYEWFIGFAPAEDPQIAFSAMVINHERGKVKAAYVAQEALKTFFRGEIN